MTTEIISPSFIDPGAFAEVNVGVGPGTAAIGARDAVFVAPKLSTGAYTAATRYQVEREQDVIDGAGAGSPLHRAVRKFLEGNRQTKVWVVPVAETSGGSPVAGTFVATVSGSPSAAGWADVFVCGEQCRYTYGLSDTPTTIATGLKELINAKVHLPVVATNVAGALTLTAKLKGVSQNATIQVRTAVKASTTVAWSTTGGFVGDTVTGAEGSTTEAANLATALAILDADAGYYIGVTAFDSTSIGNLVTHLAAAALPQVGLRKRGFVGFNGTISAAGALAIARNYERLHIVQQYGSDHDAAELVGCVLGVYALEESADPSFAPVGYRGPAFTLRAAADSAKWPDGQDRSDALSDGVLAIGSDKNGAFIVDGVTTRSKDTTKTYDDRRSLYSERISMADAFADRVVATYVLRYNAKKLDADEFLSDGTLNTNQTYDPTCVKPSQVRDMLVELLRDAEKSKELVNVTASIASLTAVVSSTNSQRIVCRAPIEVIGRARQGTFQIDEVSRG